MKLIVGLGNPGKEYVYTRHNVGFIIVDNYVANNAWSTQKNLMMQSLNINGEKVLVIKPITFMNLSGLAVKEIVDYYKIQTEDILVIHDDLDLPFGTIKFKKNSSSGGHNGIKSIIDCLESDNFNRLKIGIGKNDTIATRDYVLGKLSLNEINELKSDKFSDIINYYLSNGIESSMNKYNSNGE